MEFMNVVGFLILACCISPVLSRECVCAKQDTLLYDDISSLSRSVLGWIDAGECLPLTGFKQKWKTYTLLNVMFKDKSVWIFDDVVGISDCGLASKNGSQLPGCPPIVSRAEWGARAPSHPLQPLTKTPYYAFIHHGDSLPCFTKADCIIMVKAYQNYHMDVRGSVTLKRIAQRIPAYENTMEHVEYVWGWWDIGYSFVLGEDGNVYEGRGWDSVGAHTEGYNSIGLGFCVIGNFTDHVPDKKALTTMQQLIKCGQDNGKLTNDYTLRGHRDVGHTECPGQSFYDLIRTWPHYWK